VARQEILGECLGAFQLRGALGRPEALQATGAEQVNDTGHQRDFRTDDGQRDVLLGEIRQLLQRQYVDGNVFALGFSGSASIARGDEDFLDTSVLRDLPGQSVFTATAAND
jgi:hypothetical protein